MRLLCWYCHKTVSSELPDSAVFRAIAVCPECIEKSPEAENHPLTAAQQPAPEQGDEREILIKIAALSFKAVEGGPVKLSPKMRALDRYLANDVPDDLWEEINLEAEKQPPAGGEG